MFKKRSVALLEIVVAISIFSILLAACFGGFFMLTRRSYIESKVIHNISEDTLFYHRLDNIFNKSDSVVYTKDNSLIFFFDRGVVKNPILSNKVLGMIWYDSVDLTLNLTIFPCKATLENKHISENFILMENVIDCSFLVYNSPENIKSNINNFILEEEKQIGWCDLQDQNKAYTPELIKIEISRHSKDKHSRQLNYIFDLHPNVFKIKKE